MDLSDLITQFLAKANPALLATLASDIVAVKTIVSGLRKLFPRLAGNILQTLAAAVAVIVVTVEGLLAGAFPHFSIQHDLWAILAGSIVVWLGSIGLHEVMTDRGPSKPPLGGE